MLTPTPYRIWHVQSLAMAASGPEFEVIERTYVCMHCGHRWGANQRAYMAGDALPCGHGVEHLALDVRKVPIDVVPGDWDRGEGRRAAAWAQYRLDERHRRQSARS